MKQEGRTTGTSAESNGVSFIVSLSAGVLKGNADGSRLSMR